MQAVREWRELYRGPKNGCRISRLKPCCTYSVRVRVRNSQFRHERFSTLPLAPPAALVRRWVPVPRPNKDPRSTRERALELVLGGPEAWWGKPTNEQGGVAFGTSGVAGIPRPATALGMLAARAGRTTRGAESYKFGTSRGSFGTANRFHGLKGGAQNGGGHHTRAERGAGGNREDSHNGFAVGSRRMTSLPEGWTFAIEQHILKPEMVNLLETEMEDVARGGADEFFFRHPIPEHDAVTAAASGVAAVGHSEGEAVKVAGDEDEEALVEPNWTVVCKARTTLARVDGLEAPAQHKQSAREARLAATKKRFEAGYIFKPAGGEGEGDAGMTVGDKEGAATSSVVRGRTMERRLYIFRVRIERLDDPTIHSAPSPLLLCEAP